MSSFDRKQPSKGICGRQTPKHHPVYTNNYFQSEPSTQTNISNSAVMHMQLHLARNSRHAASQQRRIKQPPQ
jgi:hypothetical protein